MYPKDLIGKWAVRKTSIIYTTGVEDWSYTSNPVKILDCSDSHILIEYSMFGVNNNRSILNRQWIDCNWVDVDEWKKAVDDSNYFPQTRGQTMIDDDMPTV